MVKTNNSHEALSYCNCIKCRRSRGELIKERVVTTNSPRPPGRRRKVLTTRDLPPDLPVIIRDDKAGEAKKKTEEKE